MIGALGRIVGEDQVLTGSPRPYGEDATGPTLGVVGAADAVVRPRSVGEVRQVVAWCYAHDVAIVPRGGGTGFAGGAVPTQGGVVLSLERMTAVRAMEPEAWRVHVEAGVTTHTVSRIARETGLFFPPNPGAAEQSLIGGNIATNAGGSRAFKYGSVRRWVTGLEVVVAPGEVLHVGGPIRKDVTGYDLVGLFTGSEGTLGVITAAWLSLIPVPEDRALVCAAYDSVQAGCDAIEALFASGVQAAAIELIDPGALRASRLSFPRPLPDAAAFLVIVEVDGSPEETRRIVAEAQEALEEGSLSSIELSTGADVDAMLRWRDGVSWAVNGVLGHKLSEDIVVPVDRIAHILGCADVIGARHGLPVCSWGHAGDGNLHVSFLLPSHEGEDRERALRASHELHAEVVRVNGAISGEHGIGYIKRGELEQQLGSVGARIHGAVKHALDPKGLLNPDKKH